MDSYVVFALGLKVQHVDPGLVDDHRAQTGAVAHAVVKVHLAIYQSFVVGVGICGLYLHGGGYTNDDKGDYDS